MNRFLLASIFVLTFLTAHSQEQLLIGTLQDSLSGEPLQFAHVRNYSTNQGTITNVVGDFRIPASVGDTVVFSIVGYQVLGWPVEESWLADGVTLKLPKDTIVLDEVTISNLPPEELFKQQLLNHTPKDTSFWYYGMSKPKPIDNAPLSEKQINNPLFAISQPADFLYQKFSKQAKEQRKYHKVVQNQSQMQRVNEKFTRDFVQNVTGLEGDDLTSFIYFCDYSLDYLDRTPLYAIREDLLTKLEKFKNNRPG